MSKLFLATVFLCLSALSFAQDAVETGSTNQTYLKNNVKWNVSSLAFGSYHFTYERSLTSRLSVSAGLRLMPRKSWDDFPFAEEILEQIDDESGLKDELKSIGTSGQAYTLELRYYFGSPGPRGFYAGLYGRYSSFDYDYTYTLSYGGYSETIPIAGTFRGVGGGALFGVQFPVARRFVIDFTIIGAHIGRMSGDGFGTRDLSMLTNDQKRFLEEDLESRFEIDGRRYIEAQATDKGVGVRVEGPFAGVRAVSLSVGIAF